MLIWMLSAFWDDFERKCILYWVVRIDYRPFVAQYDSHRCLFIFAFVTILIEYRNFNDIHGHGAPHERQTTAVANRNNRNRNEKELNEIAIDLTTSGAVIFQFFVLFFRNFVRCCRHHRRRISDVWVHDMLNCKRFISFGVPFFADLSLHGKCATTRRTNTIFSDTVSCQECSK